MLERIVPAGIQDDDIRPIARREHLTQDRLRLDRDQIQVRLIAKLGIDRQQIVVTKGLYAVPGEVEQPDCVLAGLAQRPPELGRCPASGPSGRYPKGL